MVAVLEVGRSFFLLFDVLSMLFRSKSMEESKVDAERIKDYNEDVIQ